MKTRIKVEDGKYYPQYNKFGIWWNFPINFTKFEYAAVFIDEELAKNSEIKVHYIEYPKPVKMLQGCYQPKAPSTGYSVPPPPPAPIPPKSRNLGGKPNFLSKVDVTRIVYKILESHLGVPYKEMKLKSEIVNDFCADPLDTMKLIMIIEDRFNLNIPDEDAERIVTISDIVECVYKRL